MNSKILNFFSILIVQYDDQEEEGLDEVDEELLTSSSEHLTSLDGAAASTERPRHESSGSDGTATSEAVDLQSEVTAEDLVIFLIRRNFFLCNFPYQTGNIL